MTKKLSAISYQLSATDTEQLNLFMDKKERFFQDAQRVAWFSLGVQA
jgi:hypothetical protein